MKQKDSNFPALQNDKFNIENTSAKMRLSEVFAERRGSYLNELTLFIAHFNSIPNFIHEININCKKAVNWFEEHYKTEIKDKYFNKRYYNQSKMAEEDDIFYFIYADLLVDFDSNSSIVRFLFKKTALSEVEKVIHNIRKFRKRKEKQKPEIKLLVPGMQGLDTKAMEISKPRLNIEDNYNDDFKEIHELILVRLSKKNDKGLVLLHGRPGTGKTSYIRYLISSLKKDVIFLPPTMAASITDPTLVTVLIDNPNSIFVIEDAEKIIVDREKNGSSPVSALLNISDGLLSDCLNIQVICSFNTDVSKIDSALLRKGRLIAKYEFKELGAEKAKALSEKLGYNQIINGPVTLSEIYNNKEKGFSQVKTNSRIGFRSSSYLTL